ncbi:sugar transferase [Calderihabitans maritimus]|uniref:Lipopolysaccharide synthesis sugar transferase n=1 Tax=Calderihabitans maritimus TaxID=1246530 RepID=A0A1Z5HXL4_9FIRM|nr:sugar transferase [Calderihabitans maritimus]GAW94055.1 lipopolysaccharide synthesis sugar transferase [Calderihabitans maritimus]
MRNGRPRTLFDFLLILGDLLLVNSAFILAFLIRFKGRLPAANFDPYVKLFPWISLVAVAFFNLYGLYYTVRRNWRDLLSSLICSVGLIFLSGVVLSYMTRAFAFPRTVFFLAALLQLLFLGVWRRFMWRLERKLHGSKKVVIVGTLPEAQELAGKLSRSSEGVFGVQGLIVSSQERQQPDPYPLLGRWETADRDLLEHSPDLVYICSSVPQEFKKKIIAFSLSSPWEVYLVPDLYDILVVQASLDQIDDTPVFHVGSVRPGNGLQFGKRLLDVALSAVGLVLASPIMLLISLAVKLDSPGPVFYTQERISYRGQTFKLIKFRTMIKDAEKHSGPVLAAENDPRITRVGKFLRATRLDELPQLINVLKGEMSLVGPRPERPYFVQQFEKEIPEYSYRHIVKSGITGLAQVAGKYSTSPKDKLRFDLLYARKASLLLDLQILFQTLKVLFTKGKNL